MNIEFLFTFEQWVAWWEKQLGPDWAKKRGQKKGQYVMARHGDKGPYSVTNVKCITSSENGRECQLGRTRSPATRLKISNAMKAHRNETR